MRKRTKRKSWGVHPLQSAYMKHKWDAESVTAQIHAALGEDKVKLMAYASILFFIAGACAIHLEWTGDEPDFRIIRGAINQLDDMNVQSGIRQLDRNALTAGMWAAQRVLDQTPGHIIDEAALLYYQHQLKYGR